MPLNSSPLHLQQLPFSQDWRSALMAVKSEEGIGSDIVWLHYGR